MGSAGTTTIRITVLGELGVVRDGVPLPVGGPGRRALLALLAATPGRVVPVERIVDGLWGEVPPASAPKVVQTYVSQLRRLLEPGRDDGWQVLVTRSSGYLLAVARDAVDAPRFEAAVRAASDLPLVEAVDPLRDALTAWRGPPYAGIDRPFARAEADRLSQIHLSARTRCLAGDLARGRSRQVEPELRALVADHPLDESLVELSMLALYRDGHQAEALQAFARLRRRLADELGADPGPGISALHERILRHDGGLAAASGPGAAVPASDPTGSCGNLPCERSSFVGRRAEVAEVARMITGHRLTTLVGAGGAGKTRLALRGAAAAAEQFKGAWLVALGSLEDPDHLAGHCLTDLGLTDQMQRSPEDTLCAWIGERHLLLVLDNCEHLVTAVAELADRLLAACPRLHVLATSRQPLHCPGERQWRVPALTVPRAPDVESVAASESGSLLVSRAGDARPGFRLDEGSAEAAFRICRRLDGIPLAIELAAVRMASMSPDDVAAGLDHRFRLLTLGSRTALPRQRTLLATTDWSYGLLPPAQQTLLCRLAVFTADVDLDAVVDVCGFPPLDPRDVPGLLADLVDQSLVEPRDLGGHTRYRLLETVRQYGQDRLGDAAAQMARRYGDWVARLVESVGRNAQRETAVWYGRLDREFVHLQAAFAAAARRGDAETALRIAAGSGWAMIIIGRFDRQREWVRQALSLAEEAAVDERLMAQGLLMAGAVAGVDQRFDGTLEMLDGAEERFTAVGDAEGTSWARYWRAATLAEMGRLDEALTVIATAVEAAAAAGLAVVEANTRAEQAEVHTALAVARDDLDGEALSRARTALAAARRVAEPLGMQELLARIGVGEALLAALAGEVSALPRCLRELDAWRALGRGNRLILGLVATAKVALRAERPDVAWTLVGEAGALIDEFTWSAPLRGALEVLTVLSAPRDAVAAATMLGAAEAWPPPHRWRMPADVAEVRAALQRELGPELFATGYAQGAALDVDEAIRLVRTAAEPGGPR